LDALNEWRIVTQLNPNSPNAYTNLGGAYFKLGRYDEALNAYKQSLEKEKTETGYIGLGAAQYHLQRYAEAADSLIAAIKLNQKDAMIWANLGDAYRQMPGEEQQAINAYTRAITIRQGSNPGARGLARIAELYAKRSALKNGDEQRSLDDMRKGINLITTALKLDPGKVEIYADAIVVFHLTGDRDRALYFVDQALARGSSFAEIQNNPEIKELRLDPRYQSIIWKYQQ
jgi:tetratricopeptide (TPR) repeat protein